MATSTRASGLSRERILDAARELVAQEGMTALSMRRLAQELDVWPMSVYRYFEDKDELLDALAASAVEAIALPSASDSWRAQLEALLRNARVGLGEDPSGISSRMGRAFLSPGALRVSEAGMRILRSAGFDPAEASSAWRALWSYTFGFATFRIAPAPDEALRQARMAIAALPDAEYPTLLASAHEFAHALVLDEEFEYGLERLLDGLEARLAIR
jgi:AcrR family transcriptional regulator